jgi:hypothetical protein
MTRMNRCAWCGAENDPARSSCVSCGTRLSGLDRSQEESTPAPPIIPAMPVPAAPPPAPAGTSAGWGGPTAVSQGWGTRTGQQPAAQTWPPATQLPGTPTPNPPRRPLPRVLLVAIVAGILAALGLFLLLRGRNDISYPSSIGSYQRDDSDPARALTDPLENQMKAGGYHAEAAVYGAMPNPAFVVAAFDVSGSPPPGTFEAFAHGFESTSGLTVALNQTLTQTQGDATYTCAPVPSAARPDLALCLWDDEGTGGFVFSTVSSDAQSAVDLTAQIHDAVVH